MKKIIAAALVIAMFLSTAALAEQDPIVNSWYMLYSKALVPEFADSFQGCDLIIAVYSFMEDGTIIGTENDIKDGVSTPLGRGVGKWEKDLFGYKYSIIGLGSGEAKIKNNALYLKTSAGPYLIFRKMEPYNPYTDYEY